MSIVPRSKQIVTPIPDLLSAPNSACYLQLEACRST